MDKSKFYIPQVEDDTSKKEEEQVNTKKAYEPEKFVSSVYGTRVKDETSFAYVKFGNYGRQYDAFREKQDRINKNDYQEYIIKNPDNIYDEDKNNTPPITPQQVKDEYYEEMSIKPTVNNNTIENKPIVREYEKVLEKVKEYDNVDFDNEEENTTIINKPVKEIKEKQVISTPVNKTPLKSRQKYIAPPLSLLKRGKAVLQNDMSAVQMLRQAIDDTLKEFDIPGRVVQFTKGPTITQFEIQLEPGVKVQKIKTITNNFMANLKAKSIRIQAPIPGQSTIGIEVPNRVKDFVFFGEMMANEEFLNDGNPMNVVLGMDVGGKPVYVDLVKMPHGLIAGTTGSGKSVCINCMLASIMYKAHPDDVKLILVDPKIIEFSNYEDIPHLATPVITEPKVAAAALRWCVDEMENRYKLFRTVRVKNYEEYNKLAAVNSSTKHIPYIVIVIDELADLMLISGGDVEESIQRLTQKGRAAGVHIIVATQRPSVDVIKGTIKTNIRTRIAFQVNTAVDSSIILDHIGAEKLLGEGDMLYDDSVNERRLQGAYISNEEIRNVTDYIKDSYSGEFLFTEEQLKESAKGNDTQGGSDDELFKDIARFVVENNSASINRIQKTFEVGFNRAQSIMQALEDLGVVSENLGSRPRIVQVDLEQLEDILNEL